MYTIWMFILAAAMLGASFANPIAGAGHSAPFWIEAFITAGIVSGAVAILVAISIILFGLRSSAANLRKRR